MLAKTLFYDDDDDDVGDEFSTKNMFCNKKRPKKKIQ